MMEATYYDTTYDGIYNFADEDKIVWLIESSQFTYVCEIVDESCEHRVNCDFDYIPGMVAYATLKPETQSDEYHSFKRRVWMMNLDKWGTTGPLGAVLPATIFVGKPSTPVQVHQKK